MDPIGPPIPAFLRELSRDTGLCWALGSASSPTIRRPQSTARIPAFVHKKKFPAIKCRLLADALSQPRSVLLVAGFAAFSPCLDGLRCYGECLIARSEQLLVLPRDPPPFARRCSIPTLRPVSGSRSPRGPARRHGRLRGWLADRYAHVPFRHGAPVPIAAGAG